MFENFYLLIKALKYLKKKVFFFPQLKWIFLYYRLISSLTTWGYVFKIKKKSEFRDWRMVQWLPTLMALPKEASYICNTHFQYVIPAPGNLCHFLGSVGISIHMAYRNLFRNICIHVTSQFLIKVNEMWVSPKHEYRMK